MDGRRKELPDMAEVLRAMRLEVEEQGLKLSNTEGGKDGKSKVLAPFSYLEENLQECSKKKKEEHALQPAWKHLEWI